MAPQETNLYYLQSRYYDPEVGRFLNADVLVSSGQGILGNNMFAYCRNNPVRRIDISGTTDADCVDENPLDEEDLLKTGELGGANSSFGSETEGFLNNSTNSSSSHTATRGSNSGSNPNVQSDQTPDNNWNACTFDTGYQSMMYHYEKHVVKEGLSDKISVEQYTQDALEFANNNASLFQYKYSYNYGNVSWQWKYSAGKGGYFTSSGQIITFWYRCM